MTKRYSSSLIPSNQIDSHGQITLLSLCSSWDHPTTNSTMLVHPTIKVNHSWITCGWATTGLVEVGSTQCYLLTFHMQVPDWQQALAQTNTSEQNAIHSCQYLSRESTVRAMTVRVVVSHLNHRTNKAFLVSFQSSSFTNAFKHKWQWVWSELMSASNL